MRLVQVPFPEAELRPWLWFRMRHAAQVACRAAGLRRYAGADVYGLDRRSEQRIDYLQVRPIRPQRGSRLLVVPDEWRSEMPFS